MSVLKMVIGDDIGTATALSQGELREVLRRKFADGSHFLLFHLPRVWGFKFPVAIYPDRVIA